MGSGPGIGNSHSCGTGFPSGVTVASTWNRELMRARGFDGPEGLCQSLAVADIDDGWRDRVE
jgi:hypothetical protein